MRLLAFTLSAALFVPAVAQERTAPKKPPTFAEAIDTAKQAADAEQLGKAIAALQAAIRDLQIKQRVAILAGLPKPEGWSIHDTVDDPLAEAGNPAMHAMGLTVQRRYAKGGATMTVDVTANSPMVPMLAVVFANPALITADGGELVKYGVHKASLKKAGDDGLELQILMHELHLVRVEATGIGADDLLKIFNQTFVDGLEKPLGK